MSYSLSDIQAIGAEYLAQIDAMVPSYVSIFDEITAVDPAAPDATNHLDALQVARNALNASFDDIRAKWSAAINDIGFFTSNAEVKAYVADVVAKGSAKLTAGKTGPQLDAAIVDKRGAVSAVEKKTAEEAAASTTPAGTSGTGNPPAPAKELTGSASDDATKSAPAPAGSTATPVTTTPTTVAGKAVAASNTDTPTALDPVTIVGKRLPGQYMPDRLKNPLGNFSSSTYQLSLYMVSPDAYNMFVASGKQELFAKGVTTDGSQGVALVAQSGGSTGIGADKRAPGFELDYYIDDLKFKSYVNAKVTQTETNTISIEFTVTEPYGFSFVSRLVTASKTLQASSKMGSYNADNPSRQFFILGIRFQGYDETGKVVVDGDKFAGNASNVNGRGVFERLFEITVTSLQYKIDGKATTYKFKASSTPIQIAGGSLRGRVNTDTKVVASTVAEAIGSVVDKDGKPVPPKNANAIGLLDILNKNQQALVANKDKDGAEIANVYKLRFQDTGDGLPSLIGNAFLSSLTDTSKDRSAGAVGVKTSADSTVAAKSYPILDLIEMVFKNDISIMQAISMIVSQSTYLENAMKKLTKSDDEENSYGPDGELLDGGTATLKWFNLATEVKVLGWDKKRSDWAYEITYVIQPYDTPMTTSTYGNKPRKYYGPYKRYDYWYTGLNTEILQYEQTLNNNWFVINSPGAFDPNQGLIPVGIDMQDTGNKQASLPGGNKAINSYITNLTDPGGWVTAKIKILGDPDYLITNRPTPPNQVYSQFYYEDGSINANGGQVFIEVNFKEGVDYNHDSGLMDINKNIMFWKYPASVQKSIDSRGGGVCFMVNSAVSTFSKGSFTQDLECIIGPFPPDTPTNDVASAYSDSNNRSMDTPTNAAIAQAYSDTNRGMDTPTNAAIAQAYSDANSASRSLDVNQVTSLVPAGYSAARDSQAANVDTTPAGYSAARDSQAANGVVDDDARVVSTPASTSATDSGAGRE